VELRRPDEPRAVVDRGDEVRVEGPVDVDARRDEMESDVLRVLACDEREVRGTEHVAGRGVADDKTRLDPPTEPPDRAGDAELRRDEVLAVGDGLILVAVPPPEPGEIGAQEVRDRG